jgi:hypothetical protein
MFFAGRLGAGPERGVCPVGGRGSFTIEWQVPGVSEADRALAAANPAEVAAQLLRRHPAPASVG